MTTRTIEAIRRHQADEGTVALALPGRPRVCARPAGWSATVIEAIPDAADTMAVETRHVSKLDGEDGWTVDARWREGSFPVFANGYGSRCTARVRPTPETERQLDEAVRVAEAIDAAEHQLTVAKVTAGLDESLDEMVARERDAEASADPTTYHRY